MCVLCGICGFWDLRGGDISGYLRNALYVISHRGPDGVGVFVDGKLFRSDWGNLSFPSGSLGLGHVHLAIVGEPQPITNEDSSLFLVHNGEVYNYVELRAELESVGHVFSYKTDSELILHAFESGMLNKIRGDYAFAVYDVDGEEIYLYRDFPGIRPLFYCVSGDLFAFCSERKGLRHVCGEIYEVRPGERIIYSRDSLSRDVFFDPYAEFSSVNYIRDESLAVKLLKDALVESVGEMCHKGVGLPFSGGLDSSLIALLAKSLCGDVRGYVVGFDGSKDIVNAKSAAELLNVDLEVVYINEHELEWLVEKTVYHVEDWDPVKVSIAVPIFRTFMAMREDGFKVSFSGQGADELFGGYARYLRSHNLMSDLFYDLLNIYSTNLNRDDHVSMANSIEVRYPYLSLNVIDIALRISTDLKIRRGVRKYILRRTAMSLGIPKEIALREKKAIQYGSGSSNRLRKLAKRRGKKVSEYLKSIYSKFF